MKLFYQHQEYEFPIHIKTEMNLEINIMYINIPLIKTNYIPKNNPRLKNDIHPFYLFILNMRSRF